MVVAALVLVASSAAVATTLAPGFASPVQFMGTSGGDDRATRFGVSPDGVCTGWIPEQPQHTLTLTETQALRVHVAAPADTTLVMHGPAGSRCNDDRNGHDPGLDATFEAGTWQVYVGSYDRTARTAYTLTITPQ
jgi:hypothetical protein